MAHKLSPQKFFEHFSLHFNKLFRNKGKKLQNREGEKSLKAQCPTYQTRDCIKNKNEKRVLSNKFSSFCCFALVFRGAHKKRDQR
jgi:hypothetical protein